MTRYSVTLMLVVLVALSAMLTCEAQKFVDGSNLDGYRGGQSRGGLEVDMGEFSIIDVIGGTQRSQMH